MYSTIMNHIKDIYLTLINEIIIGPPTMPIIGNMLSVWLNLKKIKYHHSLWQYWSQKYGNILGLRLGYINVVIVFGKDLIREVSGREVFNGRPNGLFYLLRSFGKKLGKYVTLYHF